MLKAITHRFINASTLLVKDEDSISIFSIEKPLFLKERLSKTYSVGTYYWSKNLAELPFQILYPLMNVTIIYFSIGLNNSKS